MRMILMFLSLVTLINVTGCSHVAGNVVPQRGPTMEQVYDSMEADSESNIKQLVRDESKEKARLDAKIHVASKAPNEFQKIPNPELHMYVYPHLAGHDEIPIPGYATVFNVYTRDHYVLSSEPI